MMNVIWQMQVTFSMSMIHSTRKDDFYTSLPTRHYGIKMVDCTSCISPRTSSRSMLRLAYLPSTILLCILYFTLLLYSLLGFFPSLLFITFIFEIRPDGICSQGIYCIFFCKISWNFKNNFSLINKIYDIK